MAEDEYPVLKPVEQQALVTAFFSRRSMSLAYARKLLQAIKNVGSESQTVTDDELDYAISQMNESLGKIDMKVETFRDQETRETQYILVNKNASELAKGGTRFTINEIEYFRSLIDYFFTNPKEGASEPWDQFWISEKLVDKPNRSEQPTGVRKSIIDSRDVDGLIKRLVDEDWLCQDYDGSYKYSMSNRMLCELSAYLRQRYGSDGDDRLRLCAGCNNIFTKGWQCKTSGCAIRVHVPCARPMLARHGGDDLCPGCNQNLVTGHVVVGINQKDD